MTQATRSTNPLEDADPPRADCNGNVDRFAPGTRALVAVLVLQAVSYLPALSAEFHFNAHNHNDATYYVLLGQSIQAGRGYTRSMDPQDHIPHTTWPPGFPMMLAACFALSSSMLLPHCLVALTAMLNTVLFWRISRDYLPVLWRLPAALLLVCSATYDQLATVTLAEHATVACLLAALLCLQRWQQSDYRWNRWALGLWGAVGYGLLVKPSWIAFVPICVAWAGLSPGQDTSRRKRLARVVLLMTLAMGPWVGWLVRCQFVDAPSYEGIGQVGSLLTADKGHVGGGILAPAAMARIVWENLKWYAGPRILDLFAGSGAFLTAHVGRQYPGGAVNMAIIGLLGLSGVVALWRLKRLGLLAMLVLLLPGPLMLKHNGGAPRYWMIWYPVGILFVCAFVREMLPPARRARARTLGYVAAVLVGGAAVAMLAADHRWRHPHGSPRLAAFHEIASKAGQFKQTDADLLFSDSPWCARFVARFPANIPATGSDLDGLWSGRHGQRSVFVIRQVPGPDGKTADEFPLDEFPGTREKLFVNDYYELYRILPAGAATLPSGGK